MVLFHKYSCLFRFIYLSSSVITLFLQRIFQFFLVKIVFGKLFELNLPQSLFLIVVFSNDFVLNSCILYLFFLIILLSLVTVTNFIVFLVCKM